MANGKRWASHEDGIVRETYAAWQGRLGWAVAAAKRLPGRSADAAAKRLTRLVSKGTVTRAAGAMGGVVLETAGDTATAEWEPSPRIRSLDALLKHAQVDRTVWEIERYAINKWEVGAKHPVTGEIIVAPLFQVKVWLKKKPSELASALFAGLLDDIRKVRARPPAPTWARRARRADEWLFEFTPFDLHMGKYTWDEETVTNYDADLADDLFRAAMEHLTHRAIAVAGGRLDRVLCVFGNDVSHVDSKRGETTGGTRMDFDTRYIRVYRRICDAHRAALLRLREIAPVDVVIVPGNHDELTSFHLGEFLSAYFHADKHVSIDNSARLRKYYEYGVNLFGFAHGDTERVAELPLLMAREEPDRWARCPSREWHIGHKHIAEKYEWKSRRPVTTGGEQDLFSDKGVRVRRLMSLSAHDAWHTKHAYTDRRACDSFVFHRTAGFSAHLSFNVDHFTGKPMRTAA